MSFNRWNYVNGNPINYTDPSGHLACKDVVSKWRDIFEKLGLCNPDEEPTISSQRMEELEKWSDPNLTPCVFVMTVNGLQCIAQDTKDEDECPSLLIQAETSEKLSLKCKLILVEIRAALNGSHRVKQRYQEWAQDILRCRDDLKRNPRDEKARKCVDNHRKSYRQAQVQLRNALQKWDNAKCGELPGDVRDAKDWVNKPLP